MNSVAIVLSAAALLISVLLLRSERSRMTLSRAKRFAWTSEKEVEAQPRATYERIFDGEDLLVLSAPPPHRSDRRSCSALPRDASTARDD